MPLEGSLCHCLEPHVIQRRLNGISTLLIQGMDFETSRCWSKSGTRVVHVFQDTAQRQLERQTFPATMRLVTSIFLLLTVLATVVLAQVVSFASKLPP